MPSALFSVIACCRLPLAQLLRLRAGLVLGRSAQFVYRRGESPVVKHSFFISPHSSFVPSHA